MFQTSTTVIKKLKAALEAMRFPETEDEAAWEGELLFERVDVYDVPRLEDALRDLLNFRNRICLIVPRPEQFNSESQGGVLRCTKSQQFILLISDRDYLPGKPSFFGSSAFPGVMAMKDVVVDQIIAETFALPDVLMEVVDGESIRVAENERSLKKGREGYRLILSTPMGEVQRPIERGRSLRRR